MTRLIFLLLCLISINVIGQTEEVKNLETNVYELNNEFKYDSSLIIIRIFLSKKAKTNDDRYYGNLFMSYTYKRLFDYKSTIQYLDSAAFYGSQTPNSRFYISNINSERAFAHFDTRNYNMADSLMQSIAKSNYQDLDDEQRSKIFMQEAYLLYLKKRYHEAELRYNDAIARMKVSSICDLPMIYAKKIELYGTMGKPELMKDAYNKSILISDSCMIIKYNLYTNEMMMKAFSENGNYKKAFFYRNIYDSLEKVYNEKSYLDKVLELDRKYQNVTKQQYIDQQEIELRRKNRSITFLIISLIMALLIALALYLWQRQKKMHSEKNAAMNYARKLLETIEEERKRIASELHDSIGHELLDLKSMIRQTGQTTTTGKVDSILESIRIISRNLHPVLFERLGLKASIENMAERIQSQNDFLLTADINYSGCLSYATELQIYRILQEAVTNIIKHSDAIAGKISIIEDDLSISIEIKDNGKGFDLAQILQNGDAFGLHNIIERTKMIGGTAKIISNNKGTSINILISKKYK